MLFQNFKANLYNTNTNSNTNPNNPFKLMLYTCSVGDTEEARINCLSDIFQPYFKVHCI